MLGVFFLHLSMSVWKSWVQKTRAPCTSCCELLSAPILVSLFALLYFYSNAADIPALTLECAGSMLDAGVSDMVNLPRMLAQSRRALALVGAPAVRADFAAHLAQWYPGATAAQVAGWGCAFLAADANATGAPAAFPPFAPHLLHFDSEAALEAYVLADGYGDSDARLGVYMAVVFQSVGVRGGNASGGASWAYRLRSNISDVPPVTSLGDPLQLGANLDVLAKYFSVGLAVPGQPFTAPAPGLVPLQAAVDRFILNTSQGAGDADAALGLAADAGIFVTQWGCSSAALLDPALQGLLASHALLPQRVRVTPFPTHAYRVTNFYALVGAIFPLFFTISFLLPAFFMIRAIVTEKEMKLREGMRMMGMSDLALTAAWYAVYIAQFLVIALIVSLTVKLSFFPRSDFGLLFALFFAVGVATTALCFLISVFFSRAKMASGVGSLLFLALFFPYFKVNDPDSANKGWGALSHTVAFGLALDIVSTLEAANQTLTWANAGQVVGGYSLARALWAIAGDAVLYSALAMYFTEVVPQEFGVPQHPAFLLSPAFWAPKAYGPAGRPLLEAWGALLSGQRQGGGGGGAGGAGSTKVSLLSDVGGEGSGEGGGGGGGLERPLEPATGKAIEPPGFELLEKGRQGKCLTVRGLRKVYPNTPDGAKAAVASVSLDMYEDQIFALLGHNGAGKSTTISMLTGLTPPTAGDAWAYGHSITRDLAGLRQIMGVCPQHDVLWPDLTVGEHLAYFARIKGVPLEGLTAAVYGIVRDVGLTEKVDVLSRELSGGMKRKLSVGIALIGDPKIVFLDEPTSGMDPYSRRFTWNILQNARKGRIMVLTTHFMDEADILGDRIAILADGAVRCCGSSMYLKKTFGVGYSLSLVKAPGGACDASAVAALVLRGVPEAEQLSNVGAEMTFQLPLTASGAFPALFAALEAAQARLGVQSYGVSVTTMEQVFVKVAEEGHAHAAPAPSAGSSASSDDSGARALDAESAARSEAAKSLSSGAPIAFDPEAEWNRETEPGDSSFLRHFWALFAKRSRFAMRDKGALVCQLVIPIAAVLGGLLLLQGVNANTPPPLRLSLGAFNTDLARVGAAGAPPNALPMAFSASSGADAPLLASYIGSSGVQGGGGAAAGSLPPYTSAAFNASLLPVAGLDALPEATGFNYSLIPNCTAPNYQRAFPFAQVFADTAAEGRLSSGPSRTPSLAEEAALGGWLLNASSGRPGGPGALVPEGGSLYGAVYVNELRHTAAAASGAPLQAAFASYSALVNTTAWHMAPTLLSIVNSGLLNWVSGGALNASITVELQPLPFSQLQQELISTLSNFFAVLFIVIAFSFIPASFAVFVVKEREVAAKHQQLISGVSIPAYWLATYAWDCVNYIVPAAVCFFLLVGFNQLVDDGRWHATLLLFVLYGTAVAPFTYVLSFAFASHSSAQTSLLILNLLCMVLLLASFVMKAIPATCAWDARLRFVYRFFPTYALGNGLQQLSYFKQLVFTESECGTLTPEQQYSRTFTPFSPEAAGWPLAYLALESVGYLAIAIGIDTLLSYPIIRAWLLPDKERVDGASVEDSDVAEEAQRVRDGRAAGDTIVVEGLRKVYGGAKTAVRSLHFGIPSGEVFGFLGINGAGKTTTLKILSGEDIPTAGTARLDGLDILREQIKVRRLLGYCPQFDSLLELLSVREHLELYGRIKGVPEARLPKVVDAKIVEFDLVNYANKLAGSLSGGNKRKLSVAISMIGSPRLIFLDEPSTGMDPVARRFMWRVINSVATVRKTCSIILTTHSMEEAEALCGRIGIMVGGRLRCLGSTQHLKHKFGQAYMAQFKLQNPGSETRARCLEHLAPHLQAPGAAAAAAASAAASGGGGGSAGYQPVPQLAAAAAAAAEEGAGGAPAALAQWHLPMAGVAAACAALGDASRVRMLHKDASGWAVQAALKEGGRVGAALFAEWWTVETYAARLHAFLLEAFPGAVLLERAGGEFLSYSIPSAGVPLSRLFEVFERERARLCVADYSLGQMSLESVFNTMAADQEEEKGHVKGRAAAARGVEGALRQPEPGSPATKLELPQLPAAEGKGFPIRNMRIN